MSFTSITAKDRRRFAAGMLYKRGIASKNQIASITDLICEGPVEGLYDVSASVFLDGDPVHDTAAEAAFFNDTLSISIGTGATQLGTVYTGTGGSAPANVSALNVIEETDSTHHRFVFIFGVASFTANINHFQQQWYTTINGIFSPVSNAELGLTASSGNPFEQFYQSDSGTLANGNHRLRVHMHDPLGNKLDDVYDEYRIDQIRDSSDNAITNAAGPKAILKKISSGWGIHNLFSKEDADEGNLVTVEIDLALKAEIVLSGGNKKIQVNNNYTNAYAITKKLFSLSAVLDKSNRSAKVKDSTIQFRRGTEFQAPLKQLAGIGTSSRSVSLSDSQKAAFEVVGSHWRDDAVGGTAYYREDFGTVGTQAWVEDTPSNSRITLMTKTITLSATGMTSGQISEIDELRLQLRYPAGIYHTGGSGGDYYHAAGHQVHVIVKRDGAWQYGKQAMYNSGGLVDYRKTKTAISRDHVIDMTPFQPYEDLKVLVTRLSPTAINNESNGKYQAATMNGTKVQFLRNSDDNNLAAVDGSQITSLVAIIKEKLNYPFTALGTVTFSARDYSGMPTRMYEVLGKKVRIPSNYTPRHLASDSTKAEYGALWDGTFKPNLVYTDNPAWVFYDMVTNDRYGLGGYIEDIDIDKYSLYKIAKYCDELVPDGNGEKEPRFRANIYLTKATDCYKVLKDMATVFRGMLYWMDGQLLTVQDSPGTPVYNFGKSNIIDGEIKTEGTGAKTRANQIIVSWNNPKSQFKLEPIIIEDRQNILDTGRVNKIEANAFGCTSQGQALRYGKWKLWTAVNQTEIISFKTGINAAFLQPGDIINVENSDDYGIAFSGRISAYELINSSSQGKLTLDRDISTESGGAQVDGGDSERSSYAFNANSTYTISVLVDTRKLVLAQDSVTITPSGGGSAITYNRGDEIQSIWLPSDNSATLSYGAVDMGQEDSVLRGHIVSAKNNNSADNETVLLELLNGTAIETLQFNSGDASVVSGKTVITFDTMGGSQASPKFNDAPTASNSIWAIKEDTTTGKAAYSYKEYKILGITEEDNLTVGISAANFSNAKFDAVDLEFRLDVEDTVYVNEEDNAPPPRSVYLLRTPKPETAGDEIIVQWDPPLNAEGTATYEHASGYEIEIFPSVDENVIQIKNANQTSYPLTELEDGQWSIGVRTITPERRSRYTFADITIKDPYGSYSGSRVAELPIGVKSDFDTASISSTTFSLLNRNWAMVSPAAELTSSLTNPSPTTAASYSQELASMGYSNSTYGALLTAYLMFDRDTSSNDYLRLINYKGVTFENTEIQLWYDVSTFAPNSSGGVENNRWTSINCNVSVGASSGTNIVTQTGGDDFNDVFQVGDVLRLYDGSKYYAGKVAFIDPQNNKLFVDRQLNSGTSTLAITANSTTKAVARAALRVDPINDSIIATINRTSGGVYSFINHVILAAGVRGRAVTATPDLNFLNYTSANALSSSWTDNISIQATAINYLDPVFKVTGDFASNANPNNTTEAGKADGSFKDSDSGTTNTYTKIVHNADESSNPIAYDDPSEGAAQVFTVTVRENNDQSNSLYETSTKVTIGKIREGVQGSSTAVLYLYAVQDVKPAATTTIKDPNEDSNFPTVTAKLSGTGGGALVLDGTAIHATGSVLISGQASGWYTTPQAPTGTQKQWVIVASANGTGTTDTVARGEWSVPQQFSGADGLDGYSIIIVEAYLLNNSSTTPDEPNQSTTYNFTGTNQGHQGTLHNSLSWSTSISAVTSSNQYLWKSTAAAISNTPSGAPVATIAANDWSTPVIVNQHITGAQGVPGQRKTQIFMYYQTAQSSEPSAPTAGQLSMNWTTGVLSYTGSGGGNTWNVSAPTFAASNTNKYWYCPVSVAETGTYSGSAYTTTITVGDVEQTIGFSGLVTFVASGSDTLIQDGSGSSFNYTSINGSNIKTGAIQSTNFVVGSSGGAEENFATRGARFDLAGESIKTPFFFSKWDNSTNSGSAGFNGNITFGSGDSSFGGNAVLRLGPSNAAHIKMHVDSSAQTPKIEIYDASGDVRVKLGFLS